MVELFDWVKRTMDELKDDYEVRKRQNGFKKAMEEAERTSALRVRNELLEGLRNGDKLPITQAPIILQRSELCHFCTSAVRLIAKKVTVGYEGASRGISVRVAPGVRFYTGGNKGYPVKAEITEKYEGTIVISSKRIVFISDRKGFTIPLSKLVAVTPYTDGYGFQKDSTNYLVQLPDAEYFGAILDGVINLNIR